MLLVNKKYNRFLHFRFIPCNFIISFISSKCFLVACLRFSVYKIMSFTNSDGFISSSLIWKPLISFSYLIALSRTTNSVFHTSDESKHPSIHLKEKAIILSPLSMMLAMSLLYMAFIIYSTFHLYPLCWDFLLSWMDVESCQMLFLYPLRWFLSFILLMWWFMMINL